MAKIKEGSANHPSKWNLRKSRAVTVRHFTQILTNFLDHISRKLLDSLAPSVNFKQSRTWTSEGGVSITRILLTGGPCAGKTTALAAIS
mgnify:CR=1 FL=1